MKTPKLLSGPALEVAVELHDLYMAGQKDEQALQEEFRDKLEKMQLASRMRVDECWRRLLRASDLDPAKPMDWSLDARYWPHLGLMLLNPTDLPFGMAELADPSQDLNPTRKH